MQDKDLMTIFSALKVGDFKGINISLIFKDHPANSEGDSYAERIANIAINEGFAERASSGFGTRFYGSGNFLKLSLEGRQYPTYQTYCDRHRKPDFCISNSVVGDNNLGITQGYDFHASSIINTTIHQNMSVSEYINQILHDAEEGYAAHPTRGTSDEYEKAFAKVLRHGLVKPKSKSSYELTLEGERAIELGGFDDWKKYKEQQESQRHASIHVSGGNTIIGSYNSGVSQAQDGSLINTGSKVRIDSHIEFNKGSFESLVQKLSDSQISQQDIEELKGILESDNPSKDKEIFGDKTNEWVSKMISNTNSKS
ncbi:hypothetical protein [Spirosoma utsteinense]|uniref:Uncharacterized protein n=1 Tax=Spirosoma utsteinense TaxID=2585773 RepID=A0ABR6WFM7_9BACT|nr:hypothetical protein [Spirosoma utsteinense]MBC3795350.1 hypothetical protein [Spirosoma utsteinense]